MDGNGNMDEQALMLAYQAYNEAMESGEGDPMTEAIRAYFANAVIVMDGGGP